MKIIAVDDEIFALQALEQALIQSIPGASIAAFQRPGLALDYAQKEPVDVAFLDVEMGELDGITLAIRLKEANKHTNIIFVTAHAAYMGNAFSLHASGYILKPVKPAAILKEMENLRNPVVAAAPDHIQVKCFGSFEIFIDGKPILFSRSKPKELLALLISQKGASIKSAKVAAILWEDKPYSRSLQKQTQTVISQLMKILKDAGIQHIIRRGWNNIAIDPRTLRCDYYDVLGGNVSALNAYEGEFMADYSWAELTNGLLAEAKTRNETDSIDT